MQRSAAVFLLSIILVPALHAQGFRTFSGRNHPEITWLTARTEHFEIVYPEHLQGIEAEAAAIAEESYRVLSTNLDVRFDRPIRIYLSDEDEIANGFAVPIGTGFTNIWVHVNEMAEIWTGEEKWLRKVVAHELAHIFHYRAVRSNIGLLQNLIVQSLPSFWVEGLAQYLTEDWDAQRGDRWLRAAVLDDRLSYSDGRSMWNGRLMYAIGNSQVRYFAEQYGDSTLAELLKHRRPALLGLAKVHDFGRAFRATTGKTHREFFDDWRRHVNVYYNTMAGQMENTDSLGVDPLSLPGQYLFEVRYSPDSSRVAVLSLASLARPVRRLYVKDVASGRTRIVAEGSLKAPVSWSSDNRNLVLARAMRGTAGSLINDLVLVDAVSGRERRLTHSRRALSPAFNPATGHITFAGVERQTANIFELDPTTGEERQLTFFEDDVQISSLRWDASGRRLALAVFDEAGRRDIALYDAATGAVETLVGGEGDQRDPVWAPDGASLAYTSLADDVPNVFVHEIAAGESRRATRLATGASARDWLPPDSAFAAGRLVVVANLSKERDRAFAIDAARTATGTDPDVPRDYQLWTEHRPSAEVPVAVPASEEAIMSRGRYNSWNNITHVISLGVPYYAGAGRAGIAGMTSWTEPLGMHSLAAAVALDVVSPRESWFLASYVNNQWYPTIMLSSYRLPGTLQAYGDDVLAERFTGGDVTLTLPVDWRQRPFTSTEVGWRVRYIHIDPLDTERIERTPGIPAPEAGQQLDVQGQITRRQMRPYRHNVIHPLDGYGVRAKLGAALPALGADARFVEADVSAFAVLPSLGLQRLFVYGRARARQGEGRPQDLIGLSRHDDVLVTLPGQGTVELGGSERVRGYRTYAVGDRLIFGSAEYRVPLVPDLQTRLLGLVSLGATTGAFFVDGAMVWSGGGIDEAIRRTGAGFEVKNAVRIAGLQIAHSVGAAQPVEHLGTRSDYEIYYRIRAAVPF